MERSSASVGLGKSSGYSPWNRGTPGGRRVGGGGVGTGTVHRIKREMAAVVAAGLEKPTLTNRRNRFDAPLPHPLDLLRLRQIRARHPA
jgi:hypothetical protein